MDDVTALEEKVVSTADLRNVLVKASAEDLALGPGHTMGFTGKPQRDHGPESWGISLMQLRHIDHYTPVCAPIAGFDTNVLRFNAAHNLNDGPIELHEEVSVCLKKARHDTSLFRAKVVDSLTVEIFEYYKPLGHEPWVYMPAKIMSLGANAEARQSRGQLDKHMTMRDVVEKFVKPATASTGLGLALLLNAKGPLPGTVMVSHAWDESYEQFVEALGSSGMEGPFWVCATAICQNEDGHGPSIQEQLGPSPASGPFATVLKQSTNMLAVLTTTCDIYTRLWCVFEMWTALELDVPVDVAEYREESRVKYGDEIVHDKTFRQECQRPVSSTKARCGNPKLPMNADEIAIRHVIEGSGGYTKIDLRVEQLRLRALIASQVTALNSLDDIGQAAGMGTVSVSVSLEDIRQYKEIAQRKTMAISKGVLENIAERQEVIDTMQKRLPASSGAWRTGDLLEVRKHFFAKEPHFMFEMEDETPWKLSIITEVLDEEQSIEDHAFPAGTLILHTGVKLRPSDLPDGVRRADAMLRANTASSPKASKACCAIC